MKYFLFLVYLFVSLLSFAQVHDIKLTISPICGSENVKVTASLPVGFIEANSGFKWTYNNSVVTSCINGICTNNKNSYSRVTTGNYNFGYDTYVYVTCIDPFGVLHVSDHINIRVSENYNSIICNRIEDGLITYIGEFEYFVYSSKYITNCQGVETVIVGEDDDDNDGTIESSRVALNAANSITFYPGLDVRKGSVFFAEIRNSCVQNNNTRLADINDLGVNDFEQYVNVYENEFVNVFPNPTNGNAKISLLNESIVSIYSSTSELFSEAKFARGVSEIELPKRSGVYFIKIEDGVTTKIERVVVNP